MQNRKIIFFDIDGTLYNSNKQVPAVQRRSASVKRTRTYCGNCNRRGPFNKKLREEL